MRRPVTGVVRFFHVLILAAACATISDATTWTALDHPGAGLIYTRGYDGSSVGREWHRGDFSAGLLGAVPEPNTLLLLALVALALCFVIRTRTTQNCKCFLTYRSVIAGALLLLSMPHRQVNAITINIEYSDEGDPAPHDENPSWDPAGVILKAHFQRAKQIWESLLPGDGEYSFDFQWDNDIDGLGLTTDGIDTYVEINPNFNWFADPTPNDDSEFDVSKIFNVPHPGDLNGQTLFSELSSANQSTYFPGTPPPGALEVGFRGAGSPAVPSSSGVANVNAGNGYDLLSTIVHEIGHVLGLGGVEPGNYNIDPQHIGGLVDVTVLEGGGGHLSGQGTIPYLMCEMCGEPGVRRFPTATDVLVIAEDQGLSAVHLQRVGSISNVFWSNSQGWIGGAVPDISQDVYIRHGGTVTLDTNAQAKNLLVTSGNSLNVQDRQLTVDQGLVFSSATVSMNPNGVIAADTIEGGPAALTTAAGTLVRFNQFNGGAATSASFNGSVAIGYHPSTSPPVLAPPGFNPSTISVWNIAEQLAIGDQNTTSTLTIDAGAKFTSGTGRIGSAFDGSGTGNVNITGVDLNFSSSWIIGGGTGALLARNGALNVLDNGLLKTGNATLGHSFGQMTVTVNDALWLVDGSIDAGPLATTGSGAGRLIVQNSGNVIVRNGNISVHGTNTVPSEVIIESGANLQVGTIAVGQSGKVTYRDNTHAYSTTFDNMASAFASGAGGITQFTGTATADTATVTNFGGGSLAHGAGHTSFSDASTAGTATFTNKGGDANTVSAGYTTFAGTSSADSGTFYNIGTNRADGERGYTRFRDSASAGYAHFSNTPGTTSGGITEFWDNSSAAHATITNEAKIPGTSFGQEIFFRDHATASNATLISKEGTNFISFRGDSTADFATISLEDASLGSFLRFFDNANAVMANITIGRSGSLQFQQNSSAGSATIRVHGGGSSGQGAGAASVSSSSGATLATLANAVITLDGGTVSGAPGAVVNVTGAGSTAGNATITANGRAVSGATGAFINFSTGGRAGTSTLIANGGSGGGGGAFITFGFGAFGDSARVVLNAGGTLDTSNNGNTNTSIGSLEGAGTANLGGTLLSVGTLDSSTTFTGAINGAAARLTKIGTGSLMLGGANTYTGMTTVNAGTLIVTGTLNGPTVVKNGGTLKGAGTLKNVTVEPGGMIAPGTSPGTMTVSGLTLASGSTLEYELGTTRDHIVLTNNGNVALGGALNLSLLDGFSPAVGQSFALFEGAIGSITGAFSSVNSPVFGGHILNVAYSTNQVVLQVGLAGDFNNNGTVDAADYTVWRKGLGTTYTQNDFNVWRANFGQTAGIGALGGANATVPEPTTLAMLVVSAVGVSTRRRWRPWPMSKLNNV
jgi:autotransporter-associated beta strand protein